MDNSREQIADIINDMHFERKAPVSRARKAQYAALESGIADALKELNRLHLRLWHAVSQRDYHSLSPDEVIQALDDIQKHLSTLSSQLKET